MRSVIIMSILSVMAMSPNDLVAGGGGQLIALDSLKSRTLQTWEGRYEFSEEQIVNIDGQKPLHLLIYRRRDRESTLLEYAVAEVGGLRVLREAATDIKGVTPVLESVDVLAGEGASEVVVRWRHPGEGGLRSIEVYQYSGSGIRLAKRSDMINEGRNFKWVDARVSSTSTPARAISPAPATTERR